MQIQTLYRKRVIGQIQSLTLVAICQILQLYGTWKISYLSYIAIIYQAMLVGSNQRSSRVSRPLDLFFSVHQ